MVESIPSKDESGGAVATAAALQSERSERVVGFVDRRCKSRYVIRIADDTRFSTGTGRATLMRSDGRPIHRHRGLRFCATCRVGTRSSAVIVREVVNSHARPGVALCFQGRDYSAT